MFAVPSLHALIEAGHHVVLAITAPPRRAGRGRREVQPAVAQAAQHLAIEVFQPERIRSAQSIARIAQASPSVLVVAAYGQILPTALLSLPVLGCVNVHPSLLPQHRGASPISGAILAGDPVTGVSIMLMDEGMDTGPVLARIEVPIGDQDDQATLTLKLAKQGADLLVQTLPHWADGSIVPEPQDASRATVTRPSQRADGDLDWTCPARELWLRVRAFADWPQGYTTWNGSLLRIASATFDQATSGQPGVVQAWGPHGRKVSAVAIGTAEGVLLPTTLQLQGGKATPVDAFLRGHPAFIGARLESPAQAKTHGLAVESEADRGTLENQKRNIGPEPSFG